MTVLLTPPAMFRGNPQTMAWARAVADQGKLIQTWDPKLYAPAGGTITTVVNNIASYNFTGAVVTIAINISFTVTVIANYVAFVLPLPSSIWPLAATNVGTFFITGPAANYLGYALVSSSPPTGQCSVSLIDATFDFPTYATGNWIIEGTVSYLSPGAKSGIASS